MCVSHNLASLLHIHFQHSLETAQMFVITGDQRVAMETLLTAIAIIKQSSVYRDERCQALVTSLKDCLVSIQGNCGYRYARIGELHSMHGNCIHSWGKVTKNK